MPLSTPSLVGNNALNDVQSITTGSFTPTNGAILVALIQGQNDVSPVEPTFTGGSLTWTVQEWQAGGGYGLFSGIATAVVGTGASMTVNASTSDVFYGVDLRVYELTGQDTTTPIASSGNTNNTGESGVYTESITATDANSVTIVGGTSHGDAANVTIDSAWTSLFESYRNSWQTNVIQYYDGSTSEIHFDAFGDGTGWNHPVTWIEVAEAAAASIDANATFTQANDTLSSTGTVAYPAVAAPEVLATVNAAVSTSSSITTGSFTPNNNSLIVAVIHHDSGAAGNGMPITISDSGAGSWTEIFSEHDTNATTFSKGISAFLPANFYWFFNYCSSQYSPQFKRI